MTSPCRWCERERGIPPRDVSYTICQAHFDDLARKLKEDPFPSATDEQGPPIVGRANVQEIYRHGHRWEQIKYSALACAGVALLGLAIGAVGALTGAAIAFWRFAQ